ncbi:MAG TPA: 50S ribosomal protein L13 [Ktedonobacteraceae bacterium]|nr:50S ribosomal protein L13 [Ktedonobacteraceae bacterium]
MKKTYSAKAADLQPQWYIIDAEGQVLGRLASQIAQILRGKHKPTFTPHLQSGDFVVVINADKIAVTGNRLDQKIYYRHTQYPGGLKQKTLRQTLEGKHPERALEHAVRGMVMHNRLGAQIMSHLKVYAGPTHPHQAQKPVPWTGPQALLKRPEQAQETKETEETRASE